MQITSNAAHRASTQDGARRPCSPAARVLAGALFALAVTSVAAQTQIIKQPPRVLPGPEDFISITAGAHHTCASRRNGNTYCWGLNKTGQVGMAGTKVCAGLACIDRPTFVMVARKVDAGIDHTCALDFAGAAFCWGNSNYGQLGNGNHGFIAQPLPVSGNHVFTSISAGQFSTCGTTAGGMFCWGAIVNGLYGAPLPSMVFAYNGYQSVSVGYNHACALDVIGNWGAVDCWGKNQFGQAGIDPAVVPIVPPAYRSSFDTTVAALAAQSDYTCADKLTGVVQCVGKGSDGQLGNGGRMTTHQPQTVGGGIALRGVSTGPNHACALDASNRVHCWGDGYSGRLGNGASVGVFASPQAAAGARTYRAVAAGQEHSCAIGTDNHIYCWGSNEYGQLGTQYPGGWVSTPVQALDP